ncbi:MAG TPA: Stk1 family PASTA domain-containing Ser/Thr kinase [Streptosporangiaceae bacterium]|jgi:serine/threonine-protein kinase
MTQPRLLGGRYELDGIVGRGGMAEVFRARDIRLDRIVAVKTLRDDLARDQTFQARFRREAQSAASLNHPSIVAVYDTGEDMMGPTPVPYIVMEYVDGRTLRDLLRDDRRLLPERALEITDGVLRALDYSHRNGIVHRDIKPGNVMLTRNGEVKVMDFGIARAVSDTQATMTQTAQVIGTAQYLSPEQARGERVDARSDLYSTGCLLYELLTGRPPFTGDSPVAIAYQHVRENPVPPSQVDPEIPRWADAIVLKAMAKDPGHRYQSAGDMRNDIQRALSGVPIAAPAQTSAYQGTRRMGASTAMVGRTGAIPPYEYGPEDGPPPGGGRKRWPWVVAAAVALALIAALIFVFQYISSSGGSFAVPPVDGLTQQVAVKQIAQAHLIANVVPKASNAVPKDHVISTSPPNGKLVKENSTVTVFVSTGAAKVAVPDVTGKSLATATNILQQAGFKVSPQKSQNSGTPPGQVFKQNPPAGAKAAPGSPVTLYYVGTGVQVPSVIGYPENTAKQILEQDGFSVDVKTVAGPSDATIGNVFQQSPTGGTAPSGSQVVIYVASAPNPPPATPTPTPTTPTPTPTTPTPTPSDHQ